MIVLAVDPRTQDVLLWDASAQWFYLYGLQVKSIISLEL